MSGNEPTNSGNAYGSGGQNDWHEQPTQGPHSPAQNETHEQPTQVSGAQPAGASTPESGFGQQPHGTSYPSAPQQSQSYPSAPPRPQQGQGGYPSAPQQGSPAGPQQGTYGQPYQAGQNPYGAPAQDPNATYGQPYQSSQPYGQQQYQPGQQYGQSQYGYDQSAGAQPTYGQQRYQSYNQQFSSSASANFGPDNRLLASWLSRVGAYLLDGLLSVIGWIVVAILLFAGGLRLEEHADGTWAWSSLNGTGYALMALGYLIQLAIRLWNEGLRQGKTGQSLGKKVAGITVVGEMTGAPLGTGRSIGRLALDILWNVPNVFIPLVGWIVPLINYLWPLWDQKNQTWSDKIVKSVVVKATQH